MSLIYLRNGLDRKDIKVEPSWSVSVENYEAAIPEEEVAELEEEVVEPELVAEEAVLLGEEVPEEPQVEDPPVLEEPAAEEVADEEPTVEVIKGPRKLHLESITILPIIEVLRLNFP